MTQEEIQTELAVHADRIAQAEREKWLMPPIPLDEKAFGLRMQQLSDRIQCTAN